VDGRDVACLIGFIGELHAPRWSALEVKGTIYKKNGNCLRSRDHSCSYPLEEACVVACLPITT
jgi:hypothetical protein